MSISTTEIIDSTPIRRYPTETIVETQLSEMTRIALEKASKVEDAPTTPRQPTHPVPPNAPQRKRSETPPPPFPPKLSRSVKRFIPYKFNIDTGKLEVVVMGVAENDDEGNPRTRESWIKALKSCIPERYQEIWDTLNLEKYVDNYGIFDENKFNREHLI
jgi:hypothetical protein